MEHPLDVALIVLIIDTLYQIESKIIITHLFNHIQTFNLVCNKLISSLIRIYEHQNSCHISDYYLS